MLGLVRGEELVEAIESADVGVPVVIEIDGDEHVILGSSSGRGFVSQRSRSRVPLRSNVTTELGDGP